MEVIHVPFRPDTIKARLLAEALDRVEAEKGRESGHLKLFSLKIEKRGQREGRK
jgi:hypothetical protein